ncbi:hypothetical protein E2C01_070602 [Portunus trituberculatus]|uniref:Uncharacterized protein n=1 Tax=Portunus trituberculatus TaxID=210409 RepID=A0A5B7I221_PORTR|nr:hypothetical protein [Portunus trituberculatus]
MRPSEDLPEQETAVGGHCGGEYSFLLRPEDDVSWASAKTASQSIPAWTPNHPAQDGRSLQRIARLVH